jgi:hypothetical protein
LYPWPAIDGEELAEASVLFEKEVVVRYGGILF